MTDRPVVAFDSLEAQKENIEPLSKGRSAATLAKAFSVDPVIATSANDRIRDEFEEELRGSADLDDPLEVWTRYLQWVKDAYPSGQSAHNNYITLLERCSKQFVKSVHYANDPRYLRIWIEYARFSDDARELFCFLARNNIGQDLATFYEEYAAFLEVRDRKGQADEIYQMGLLRGARPINRLRRKYEEFSQRLASNPPRADEPSSPPIAPIRAALTTKFGGLSEAQQVTAPVAGAAKAKLQIFTDEEEPREPGSVGTGGWGSIGTLRSRKKENSVEVRKMHGEKMQQTGQPRAAEKLSIFKDEPTIQLRPVDPMKRNERVVCNLEAVYAIAGSESSFEELKAQAMGLLGKQWSFEAPISVQPVQEEYVSVMETQSPLKDSPKARPRKRQAASPTINTKAAMDDILGLFSQPLRCEQSDDSSDSDSDEEELDNTFAVTQESQWTQQGTQSVAGSDYQSDFIEDDEVDAKLSGGVPKVSEEPIIAKQDAPLPDEREVASQVIPSVPATPQQQMPPSRAGGFDLMTPITEDTENLHISAMSKRPMAILVEDDDDDDDDESNDDLYSSPFIEHPPPRPLTTHAMTPPKKPALAEKMKVRPVLREKAAIVPPSQPTKGPIIKETMCNPMETSLRDTIFSLLFPQIGSYEGCTISAELSYGKKFEAIERYIRALNKKGGEATQHLEVILDFASRYAIKKKLGEGAFAPVFLIENISGVSGLHRSKHEAMKIEKPGSAWEFYIMRQIHRRLGVSRASESIARAYEYYSFSDCSFLILDYRDQGTILDLVNMNRTDAGGVDEMLAMFLTVELLRTVESMHAKDLLHGDLKADNCLLRLSPTPDNEWHSAYQRDGSAGWNSKGITLIDFGRGIDMKQFPSNVQFIADWKTDEQDCVEMRDARPWTYQIDYHGLACIVHSLLFGKYIETTVATTGLGAGNKKYGLKASFKRYWKQELWEPLFELLLNPTANGPTLPVTESLTQRRQAFETHLEQHGTAGIGLKGLIRKVEHDLASVRRK